jgi:chromosome segregation ATPase
VLIIRKFIWKRLEETEAQDKEQQERIGRLSEQLQEAESKLKQVVAKEEEYVEKIAGLNRDKESLSEDIDGLLEEMQQLETGLKVHRKLKEEMELQVLELKEELESRREKLQKPKKKKKSVEQMAKRFSVLYKNLTFTDRALEGFMSLTDDFQLKAEEVIHKLNEDDSQITVKRKVFGKGGKMNVLEALFAYSGRLYYQKDTQAKINVLAIGTKNTQEKDLAYLQRTEVRAPEVRTSETNDKQENP